MGCPIYPLYPPGHSNVQTTMIYTHVAKIRYLGVKSPLDG